MVCRGYEERPLRQRRVHRLPQGAASHRGGGGSWRTWILRATINSELFNSLVASANVGPGGDAFIVNRRGELQTPSRLGLAAVTAGVDRFFTRLADAGGRAKPKGDQIHCATHLNGGQWLLVLETNMAASLASYNKARRLDTALVAVAAASSSWSRCC